MGWDGGATGPALPSESDETLFVLQLLQMTPAGGPGLEEADNEAQQATRSACHS